MKIQIGKIPSTNPDAVAGYLEGCQSLLAKIPFPCSVSDPMYIETDAASEPGYCMFWLIVGQWVWDEEKQESIPHFYKSDISNEEIGEINAFDLKESNNPHD